MNVHSLILDLQSADMKIIVPYGTSGNKKLKLDLPSGCIQTNHFTLESLISTGAYGSVYNLVSKHDNSQYIIKFMLWVLVLLYYIMIIVK